MRMVANTPAGMRVEQSLRVNKNTQTTHWLRADSQPYARGCDELRTCGPLMTACNKSQRSSYTTMKISGGSEPRSRFHSFCTRLMNLPALRGVSVRDA